MSDASGAPEHQRLRHARTLYAARDYPGLVSWCAGVPADALVSDPELGFLAADALRRVGEAERALELARRIEPTCRRRGNDRLSRNRHNLEGMLLFELGDVAGAAGAWQELLAAADDASDEEFVARATQNLGVVSTLSGQAEDAVASYSRAITSYRRLGYRRGLAQAHNNLAILYRELDYPDDSDRHFERAASYAVEGSEDELARIGHERALLLLQTGDAPLAEALARRSLERFDRLGDRGEQGEALRVLGVIALRGGRWDEAWQHLSLGLDLARRTRRRLLEAELLEALAACAEAGGAPAGVTADPTEQRRDAAGIFASLNAAAWGARVGQRVRQHAQIGRTMALPGTSSA